MSVLFKNVLRKIAAGDGVNTNPVVLPNGGLSTERNSRYGFKQVKQSPYVQELNNRNPNLARRSVGAPALNVYGDVRQNDIMNARQQQAHTILTTDMGIKPGTQEYHDGMSYLKGRGNENLNHYIRHNTLQFAPPTKVQMPSGIRDPKQQRQLYDYGQLMVNNNIPGGGRGQGFGIG